MKARIVDSNLLILAVDVLLVSRLEPDYGSVVVSKSGSAHCKQTGNVIIPLKRNNSEAIFEYFFAWRMPMHTAKILPNNSRLPILPSSIY